MAATYAKADDPVVRSRQLIEDARVSALAAYGFISKSQERLDLARAALVATQHLVRTSRAKAPA